MKIQPAKSYQEVFVRLVLFHNEMYEFLIGTVVRRLTPVGQQPLWTPADFLLRFDDTIFHGIIWKLYCVVTGDG